MALRLIPSQCIDHIRPLYSGEMGTAREAGRRGTGNSWRMRSMHKLHRFQADVS